MQIVAVQLDIAWEDKLANHRRVRELLAKEKIEPGALVIVPEMFDTGFSMNVERAAQGDDRLSDAFLRALAQELNVAVLGGVVGPVQSGRATNEAVAFD